MVIHLLIFLMFLMLSTTVMYSQINDITIKRNEIMQNRIRKITKWDYAIDSLGIIRDSSVLGVYFYNKDGLLEKERYNFSENNSQWDSTIYFYNEKGYLIGEKKSVLEGIYINDGGNYVLCKTYKNKLLIEEIRTNTAATFSSMSKYEYNDKNLLISKIHFINNTLTDLKKYVYDCE